MKENLHRFFRAARGAGVRVSPAESIDAMRAVASVGFEDRGRIAHGAWADLVVLDRELALNATYVEGDALVEHA